jgi:hypothetical protein
MTSYKFRVISKNRNRWTFPGNCMKQRWMRHKAQCTKFWASEALTCWLMMVIIVSRRTMGVSSCPHPSMAFLAISTKHFTWPQVVGSRFLGCFTAFVNVMMLPLVGPVRVVPYGFQWQDLQWFGFWQAWASLLLHHVGLLHLMVDGLHGSSQTMRVPKLGFLDLQEKHKHGLSPITRLRWGLATSF